MTNVTNWLPKFLRWMFTVFVVFTALGAIAVIVVMIIDPSLPRDANYGMINLDIGGQPATILVRHSVFTMTAFHGVMSLTVAQADGFIEVLKHYGLPVVLLRIVFCLALFEVLRRLFRNVGRGQSFTPHTLRLVQVLGVSLIVYSLLSAFAESWFTHAVLAYLAQHAAVAVSGSPIHFPHPHGWPMYNGGNFPFGTPFFFSGLLVLALSEVFRQGLVLKSESDLTV